MSKCRFCAFPSVVRAGEKQTITVFPRDISRRFREDLSYEVGIIGLSDDMESYHNKEPMDLPYRIKDGTLQVEYCFSREQEYEISFCKKGDKAQKISLYALECDLFERRPMKGDFHSHSYYSDGSDGVAMVGANYREQGFDFFALTDHNRMFTSRYAMKLFEGVKLGMLMLAGEEVHTPGSLLHIVNVGAKNSVCEKYVREPEAYERAVDGIEETLGEISPIYRRRIAKARWACREIRKEGGIAILAHPFWKPYKYNLSDEFCSLLFDQEIFDAMELVGGISSTSCNLQMALWQEQALRGRKLPVVGSSDSHRHSYSEEYFGRRFTLVFAKESTVDGILDAVRSGYSVAAEIGLGDDREIRFYGDFRLVAFSHFLYHNYFDKTLELCKVEGALMQRYAAGEPVGELLDALAPSVENFYRRFYGQESAPLLREERRVYLDSLLRAQRDSGVQTRGSSLQPRNGRGPEE